MLPLALHGELDGLMFQQARQVSRKAEGGDSTIDPVVKRRMIISQDCGKA